MVRRIYLDCDGVLADFDGYFKANTGYTSKQYEEIFGATALWTVIHNLDKFFERLPLMADAYRLYSYVAKQRPVILTGTPRGNWSVIQKLAWRDKYFKGVPMVTCYSANKKDYCEPGDILVDDMLKAKQPWEEAGGIFIHHTSIEDTLTALEAYL